MIEFLKSEEISHKIEKIFRKAKKEIIILSPYIKLHQRIKHVLQKKDNYKLKIVIIYGKDGEIKEEDASFFKGFKNIEIRYNENIHAKYYANESEFVLTSMNLYDYSQENNIELGVYAKHGDANKDLRGYVKYIIGRSQVRSNKNRRYNTFSNYDSGFCIRCRTNSYELYCSGCYSSWAKYKNYTYPENYCHDCGHEEYTTISRPLCYECYQGGGYDDGYR